MDKIYKAEYEEFGIITSDNDTSAISEAESYEDKHGICLKRNGGVLEEFLALLIL